MAPRSVWSVLDPGRVLPMPPTPVRLFRYSLGATLTLDPRTLHWQLGTGYRLRPETIRHVCTGVAELNSNDFSVLANQSDANTIRVRLQAKKAGNVRLEIMD